METKTNYQKATVSLSTNDGDILILFPSTLGLKNLAKILEEAAAMLNAPDVSDPEFF